MKLFFTFTVALLLSVFGGTNISSQQITNLTNKDIRWKVDKIKLPTDATLFSVSFPDKDNGWIGGSSGSLFKTTNGGASWDAVQVPDIDEKSIRELYFVDKDKGWIVTSERGIFLHKYGQGNLETGFTSDAGKSWTMKKINKGIGIHRIRFRGKNQGWMIGSKGEKDQFGVPRSQPYLLSTNDSGKNWTDISSNVITAVNSFLTMKELTLFIQGIHEITWSSDAKVLLFLGYGMIVSSANGTSDWQVEVMPQERPPQPGYEAFVNGFLLDKNVIQLISSIASDHHGTGSDITIREPDKTYKTEFISNIALNETIRFNDGAELAAGQEGYISSDNGKLVLPRGVIFASKEKGSNWYEVTEKKSLSTTDKEPEIPLLHGIAKSSENEAWAVGVRGTIVKIYRK